MKIQYCSDLHLEFSQNRNFLRNNPLVVDGDILILAGDIVPFSEMYKHNDFFDYCSSNFKTTYWIPGNHEYYYSDASEKSGRFINSIRDNVLLLNNTAVIIEDVKIIFTSLWTNISPLHQWQIHSGMSDFAVIRYFGKGFSIENYNQFHQESLFFLESELAKNDNAKTVVVTHHVPTFMNYPEQYKGSLLNEGFAVELFDLIEKYQPDFWVYGHSHGNVEDFTIGKTIMITNQLGYVKHNEHSHFVNNKNIYISVDNHNNKAIFVL